MKDWSKPKEVSDGDLAFGPSDLPNLMPARDEIPEEFGHCGNNPWVKWQSKWFFRGLDESEVPVAKKGIDQDMAIRHLGSIQSSWAPKHEHKQEAVAYLASLWFKKCPKLKEKK